MSLLNRALAKRNAMVNRFWRPPEGVPFLCSFLEERTVDTPRSKYKPTADCMLLNVIEGGPGIDPGEYLIKRIVLLAVCMERYVGAYRDSLVWLVEYKGLITLEDGNKSHQYDIQTFLMLDGQDLEPCRWAIDPTDDQGPRILAEESLCEKTESGWVFNGTTKRKGRK